MSQRSFVIIFIILTVIGVGILGYSRFTSNEETLPAASPSSSGDIFGQSTKQQQSPGQVNIKQYPKFPGELPQSELKNKKAVIETDKGIIEFEIYPEATKAASNFIFLAQDKFFDGLTFHRVVPGFVIQGGDPLGNGTGGPGYQFEDEPVKRPYKKGTVAMANAGSNTNGSQFFIVLEDNVGLEPKYTIFGQVTKGMDVVSKIAIGEKMQKVTIEKLD